MLARHPPHAAHTRSGRTRACMRTHGTSAMCAPTQSRVHLHGTARHGTPRQATPRHATARHGTDLHRAGLCAVPQRHRAKGVPARARVRVLVLWQLWYWGLWATGFDPRHPAAGLHFCLGHVKSGLFRLLRHFGFCRQKLNCGNLLSSSMRMSIRMPIRMSIRMSIHMSIWL